MEKMKMETVDMVAQNIEKIEDIFPSCITETTDENGILRKGVDFEKLHMLLTGEESEKDEVYEFTWVGKKASIVEANRAIRKTLRPCAEDSLDWNTTENLYIEGDNLDVLKLLQESYLGKIKMIYIDPPYNTGNDFVYLDDFKISGDEWESINAVTDEEGNRMVKNTDSNGRFHSDWCSMIYPRLLLSRNLLSHDGLIFISIDENEVVNLRKMCDEIFGAKHFIAQITLLCNPKGRSQDKYIANCHEYILVYSKSDLPSGSVSIPKTEEDINADYRLRDEHGAYRELELRNTHRDFGRFNRKNLWYPFYVNSDGSLSTTYSEEAEVVYPVWDDGYEGCWTWAKEKATAEIDLLTAKRINGKTKIFRKAYAFADGSAPLKQVKSIWTDKAFFTEKGQKAVNDLFGTKEKLFQSPKSVDMLKQCILMSQDREMIVLDFFGGSSTTAQAVMESNIDDNGHRKFILVQIPEACAESSDAYKAGYENICELGKDRIRKVAEAIKKGEKGNSIDTGFRVLQLDGSNMNDVYYGVNDYSQGLLVGLESNIKADRTELDLLFGCLIDWGLPLSMPYSSEEVEGCTIHDYNEGDLIACFNEDVPESVIRKIAKRKPLRAVFRDSSFTSSQDKINVTEIFKLLAPDTSVKVI